MYRRRHGKAPCVLDVGKEGVGGQLHASDVSPPEKEIPVNTGYRMGGTQNWSGRGGEDPPENPTLAIQTVNQSIYSLINPD
jgi:hypothetical protein